MAGAHPASEKFNLATHAGGALLAAVGLAWLVWRARSPLATIAYGIYGGALVALFLSSTLHHAVPEDERYRKRTRQVDQVAIYLLIAGTYTPVCLLGVAPAWGLPLLAAAWTLAAIGIALVLLKPEPSRWVTIALYGGLGWMAMVAVVPLVRAFPLEALLLALAGGLVYSAGALVYAMEAPNVWPRFVGYHGVWHVAVLAASALQFAFIAGYVPTG